MRALWQKGAAPTGSRSAFELREDGTLGTTFAKRHLNYSEVTRDGEKSEAVTGAPFLCTWPSAEMYLLDRKLPRQRRGLRFAEGAGAEFTAFIGNGVYVGDRFMAGVVSDTSGLFGPAKVAPILVRLPGTSPINEAPTYLDATPEERKKMSVLLPSVALSEFYGAYVVPLGWKDEVSRYTFALVSYSSIEVNPGSFLLRRSYFRPRVWIGNTGQMTLDECTNGLGLDWSWDTDGTGLTDAILTGPVSCTGPGRLEFAVMKPESNSFTVEQTTHGSCSYGYLYNFTSDLEVILDTIPSHLPPQNRVLSPTPMFPGYTSVPITSPYYLPPSSPLYLAGGVTTVPLLWTTDFTAVPRRESLYIARSTDFGQTWSLIPDSSLASTSTEFDPSFWGTTGPVPDYVSAGIYGVDRFVDRGFLNTREVTYAGEDEFTYPTGFDTSETYHFSNYSQRLVRGSYEPFPPTPTSTGNRGPVGRCSYEAFTMINAGSVTFMIVPEFVDIFDKAPIVVSRPDMGDTLNLLPVDEIRYSQTTAPSRARRFTLRLLRRMGLGSFVRLAWPGDALLGEETPSHLVADALPIGSGLPFANVSASWAGLGEGRAALLLVRRNAAPPYSSRSSECLVIGTVDGGETWATIEVGSADEFRQWCVVGADGIEKHPTIVFSANDGSMRQLMRVSADFSKVTPYGREYPVGRGGLVNFKRYVHPAFPGIYDEPPP